MGMGTSITCDEWEDETPVIVCHRCDMFEAERVSASEELMCATPAELAAPATCDLCGAWVRFRMQKDALPGFYTWTGRLVDAKTQVPGSFWLGVEAVLTVHTPQPGTSRTLSIDYELFLHDILDLDLLQP
jgi:hypothetical protein